MRIRFKYCIVFGKRVDIIKPYYGQGESARMKLFRDKKSAIKFIKENK